jgi:hypothetical protein
MKDRAKAFAVRVVKLIDALPRGLAAQVIGQQFPD